MNRKLRNRHRLMTSALAVIVAGVFLAGLAVRPVTPTTGTLPGADLTTVATTAQVVVDATSIEYGRIMSGDALTAVVIDSKGLGRPDVLVYWSARDPAGKSSPVGDAYLLGTLAPGAGRSFPLPPAAAATPGYLSFYSLATRTMLQVEPGGALYLGPVQ